MKQIQLPFLSLALLTSAAYAMKPNAVPEHLLTKQMRDQRSVSPSKSLFAQKLKNFGLTDEEEIKKFYDVATGWNIDPNLDPDLFYKKIDYSYSTIHDKLVRISVRQNIGQGYCEVVRNQDGTFNINKADVCLLEVTQGAYEAQDQTYQMAMGYLDMLKSAKGNKAKQAAEEPLTMEDFLQRVARLTVNPEQQRANTLANIPVVDFSAPALPAPVSRPTPPTEGRIAKADKGFAQQAFGPESAENKKKAQEMLQRPDVKAYVQKKISLSWDKINEIAVFEDNTPFQGAWKIHIGPRNHIVWLGGLNFESTGPV